MKCPVCGAGQLVWDTRDVRYGYLGKETMFPHVTAAFCTKCDEYLVGGEEADRVQKAMRAFKNSVRKISPAVPK
ncbi:type II toxin-antitoxin system MqsA family antitoxin [Paraburkholderia strydomiana]|nr:type II toxin-antitoxin system MqsA family antitoxin [Paraburkholderia strydomiana]